MNSYLGCHIFNFNFAVGDIVNIKFPGMKAQIKSITVFYEEIIYGCRFYSETGTMLEYNYNEDEIELWNKKEMGITK